MPVKPASQNNTDDRTVTVRIAVRALAETVCRKGGLAGPVYGGVSAAEGQRLHQRFCDRLEEQWPQSKIETEYTLGGRYQGPIQAETAEVTYILAVNGRLDALVLSDQKPPLLIEVKSFSGPADHLPPGGADLHWAQVRLYAWLWLDQNPDLDAVTISLCYISQETEEQVVFEQEAKKEQLRAFFEQTCRQYLLFAQDIIRSQDLCRQSGLDCRFPYSRLRDGQKRFMQEVIGAIRQKDALFVQAPTGIGKTMAALYPAVKAVANRLTEHVFYLTAMTSTRLVAAQAIEDMRKSGLRMKALVLFAKEKLCLQPDLYCDSRQCPYATAYYDHLPAALQTLFLHETISREEILACASRHKVCPFELALDMAVFCEIIICDYNYAFDPRVRLDRFFGQDSSSHLLLVDEAHNLPDRSRSMFSAACSHQVLRRAMTALEGKVPPLEKALGRINDYFLQMAQALDSGQPGLDQLETNCQAREVMVADQFRAMREQPAGLTGLLTRLVFQAHSFLQEQPDWELRKPLLDFYFSALFFLKIAETHYDTTYVTAVHRSGQDLEIELMCLDASEKIASSYQGRHAAVFFSATLTPIRYYTALLYGHQPAIQPETLILPSPFPSENLAVLVCTALSTRYRQREASLASICELILTAATTRTGNYLVYLPSFAYLRLLRLFLRQNRPEVAIDFMFQLNKMNEEQRQQFLGRFSRFGRKTLLAFAVMGGQFAEGIDLIGEKLSGVIIIGVGLPQICPEREIMRQFYEERIGQGYAHAYLFPGFNKVQQAAGRVIRSENDRGFILMVDDRYDEEAYRQLFPPEWRPQPVNDGRELRQQLMDFWGSDQKEPAAGAAYPGADRVFPSGEPDKPGKDA